MAEKLLFVALQTREEQNSFIDLKKIMTAVTAVYMMPSCDYRFHGHAL